ncbi:MAG: dihydrofolate reductase [Rhizobiales bacterium]|nr:dihydrofolate reductase [Hyphomicrobiales bacterium]
MPFADRLEVTEVHASPEGDTRFAAIDPAIWRETARQRHGASADDSADFSYVTYCRHARH